MRKRKKEHESIFVSVGTEQAQEGMNIPHILKYSKNPLFKKVVVEP